MWPARSRQSSHSEAPLAADAPTSALLRRIDDNSTAPFAAWQAMGSPPYPTKSQLAALHAQGQLCTWKRPWLGNYKRATSWCYVFDTLQLMHILGHLPTTALPPALA